jgi:hypothetical protein
MGVGSLGLTEDLDLALVGHATFAYTACTMSLGGPLVFVRLAPHSPSKGTLDRSPSYPIDVAHTPWSAYYEAVRGPEPKPVVLKSVAALQ